MPIKIKFILWLLGDTPLIANVVWTKEGFEFKDDKVGYVHKLDVRFK